MWEKQEGAELKMKFFENKLDLLMKLEKGWLPWFGHVKKKRIEYIN
jgi:hypothetical protein